MTVMDTLQEQLARTSNIRTYFTIVTPEQAEEWLTTNVENQRNVTPHRIAKYAEIMARLGWLTTGESLIFAFVRGKRVLLEGQHRLRACVQSQTPFVTLITEGVEQETFAAMGSPKPRNSYDVFTISKIPHARLSSGISALAIKYDSRELGYKGYVAPEEAARYVRVHPEIVESATVASTFGTEFPRRIIGLLHYVGTKINRPVTETFLEQVRTGIALSADSPARLLRERLIMKTPGKNYKEAYQLGVCFKCLNAALLGKPILNLRFADNESIPYLTASRPLSAAA